MVFASRPRSLHPLFGVLLGLSACGGGSADGETSDGGTSNDEVDESAEGSTDETGPEFPDDHPRIYLNSQRERLVAMLAAEVPVATRFRDMVDGQLAGADYYAFSRADAALLGVLTEDPSYCAYAIEGIDAYVAAEEQRIANGEVAEVAGDSYLYVGETVGDLALVYDWCWAALSDAQRERWVAYANQAVWNVWHPEEASWGGASFPWSGWSIDNPSNNYYYSFLRATMLLGLATHGENDQAQTWLDTFRDAKIEAQLVPIFTSDLVGGGSREGTGYGVAMHQLFHLYDLWEASTGERIFDLTPHTRASLANILHYTVPTLDRIAPIGDHARDSTAALFDYHRSYVLTLQSLLGPEDPLSDVAQTWLDECSVPEMSQAFMFARDFFYYDQDHAAAPLDSLHTAYYAPGTGSVFFRNDWTPGATWGAFVAGPYTESHAHRDQGSLLIYRNEWLAYDQNISSHSGIVQNEEVHNLVRIEADGGTLAMVPEQTPAELVALRDTPDFLYLAADVTPIYAGATALARQDREVVFIEAEGTFVVFDRVDTSGGTAVWQLNALQEPSPTASGFAIDGEVDGLDLHVVHPASPLADTIDWTVDPDMNAGWRLDLRDGGGGDAARFLVVLAPLGAVASASALEDADTLGVDIAFTSGATASLRFDRDTIGATLQLEDSGASPLYEGPLAPGLDELPLFAE